MFTSFSELICLRLLQQFNTQLIAETSEPAAETASDEPLAPAYRVATSSIMRAGFDLLSAEVRMLKAGETIVVLEAKMNVKGQRRCASPTRETSPVAP